MGELCFHLFMQTVGGADGDEMRTLTEWFNQKRRQSTHRRVNQHKRAHKWSLQNKAWKYKNKKILGGEII